MKCELGKGAKNKEKKLTSVSLAFTHTHTLEKLTFFPFFPKRTRKILKNVHKRKNKKQYIVPCYLWLAIGALCGQDITPYGSKLRF